ncbi:hypothetical protein ACH5RR_004983 [Cinchona calisaya]|uniref:Uncharacterized protein n=1 Tax=Cinchona calisaya TaxID=153742 RepID=A0ABD3AZ40_9GENT
MEQLLGQSIKVSSRSFQQAKSTRKQIAWNNWSAFLIPLDSLIFKCQTLAIIKSESSSALTAIGLVRQAIQRFQSLAQAARWLTNSPTHRRPKRSQRIQRQRVAKVARPSKSTDGTRQSPKARDVRLQIGLKKCGPMVLDGLIKIKNEVLACLTKIDSRSGSAITITPLAHIFAIKDLVVDTINFYNQYKSIQPWLERDGCIMKTRENNRKRRMRKLPSINQNWYSSRHGSCFLTHSKSFVCLIY